MTPLVEPAWTEHEHTAWLEIHAAEMSAESYRRNCDYFPHLYEPWVEPEKPEPIAPGQIEAGL